MARRVLSLVLPASLFAIMLAGCRRDERAPKPSASVSAANSAFTRHARERHFEEELTRARTRFQAAPSLAACTNTVHEQADLALCQTAQDALAALRSAPPTTEAALARLAAGALALVRLSERLRYLSLEELAKQRVVASDAGAAPKPSASGASSAASALSGALAALEPAQRKQRAGHDEQAAVALSEGPVSQLLGVTTRLERDVLRNLGAYLEYGPPNVRRAAFDSVKQMRAEHPQWPALEHLLREAAVLEPDPELKQALGELSPSSAKQSPAQSDDTK